MDIYCLLSPLDTTHGHLALNLMMQNSSTLVIKMNALILNWPLCIWPTTQLLDSGWHAKLYIAIAIAIQVMEFNFQVYVAVHNLVALNICKYIAV